jgi:hypothetical protein
VRCENGSASNAISAQIFKTLAGIATENLKAVYRKIPTELNDFFKSI